MATAFPFFFLMGGASPSSPTVSIAGRLRAVEHRFQNDDGWFSCRSVADLAALGDVLHGRIDEVRRRFDAYQRAGRTMARTLGMLGSPPWVSAGLDFSPRTPGYESARQRVCAEANDRDMYVEFNLFADAQIVVNNPSDREAMTREFGAFCRETPGVLPGLANEPVKNGWTGADDPALLALAELFAAEVGHRDFSIGDPGDDDKEAPTDVVNRMTVTTRHCNVVVWHPSRTFGGDERWRRWLDHLAGMAGVARQLRKDTAFLVQEPIGAGPVDIQGRRDSDPDALLAGQVISALCGYAGYTYHWIPGEMDVDQLPGFYDAAADLLARLPCSPDWVYFNDGWAGSPTEGITWTGKTGKLRHLVRGNQAWSVAAGEADFNSVKWRTGWTPRVEHEGPRMRVWSVNQ